MVTIFGRPFLKRFALHYQTVSVLCVCDVGVLWPKCWMDQGETGMMQVGIGSGHIVLDGGPAPPPPTGHSTQFSAHICYDQMAGWIKMPLRLEVGLRPGDFVLDEDPAPPPQKGDRDPIFGPCLLWPNGWVDQDDT